MTTVIATCGIKPPPCTAAEMTVPLSFLDMPLIHYRITSRLIFYNYPTCSEAEFMDAIVPKLKHSLSLALQRYLPVAGNLLYPIDTKFVKIKSQIYDAGMIESQIYDGDKLMKGYEGWLSARAEWAAMSQLGVTGSPKFDLSRADFGWGKGRRVEVLSMDGGKYFMTVSNSWDSGGGGGLEVGLSLARERMEAVAAIIQDGLQNL